MPPADSPLRQQSASEPAKHFQARARRRPRPAWASMVLLAALLACSPPASQGGLRLTFPPARTWNDDVDNTKYGAPCGTYPGVTGSPGEPGSAGPSRRTQLAAGSMLNVSWSLTRLVLGGFKLELLRPSTGPADRHEGETELLLLLDQAQSAARATTSAGQVRAMFAVTPLNNESALTWGAGADPTAQSALVPLPSSECLGCTLRLTHQALGLSSNPEFRLVSCADVDVVQLGVNQCQGCSGGIAPCSYLPLQGVWQCACDPSSRLSGPYCERPEECSVDSDCGTNGKCIDTQSSNAPAKQCFCRDGWMGPQCSQQSPLQLGPQVDLSLWALQYPFNASAPNITVWWRIINSTDSSAGAQIEFAIAAATSSYVAIGWRPAGLPWRAPPDTSPVPGQPKPGPRSLPVPTGSARRPRLPPPSPSRSLSPSRVAGSPGKKPLSQPPPPAATRAARSVARSSRELETQQCQLGSPHCLHNRSLADAPSAPQKKPAPPRAVRPRPLPAAPPAATGDASAPAEGPVQEPAGDAPGPAVPLQPLSVAPTLQAAAQGRTKPAHRQPPPLRKPRAPPLAADTRAEAPAPSPGPGPDVLPPLPAEASSTVLSGQRPAPPRGPPAPPIPFSAGSVVQEVQHGFQGDGGAPGSTQQEMPPMFLQDMSIFFTRGGYYRALDAWTFPTHGTPVPDSVLGGTSDITAVSARDDDISGLTLIKFRKPLVPQDTKYDYPIVDQDYVVVWALGQAPQSPFFPWTPVSGGGSLGDPMAAYQQGLSSAFYRRGELKYHGGDKGQRGSLGAINFFLGGPSLAAAHCTRSWVQGFTCMLPLPGSACNATLHWAMRPGSVSFALSARSPGWLALGLSQDGGAVGSDVVLGLPTAQAPEVHTYRITSNTVPGLQRTQGRLNTSQQMMETRQGLALLRFDAPNNQTGGAPSIGSGSQAACHLVWAVSPSASLSSGHLLQDRGSVFLNLASGEYEMALDILPWLNAHALVAAISIALLLPATAVIARLSMLRADLPRRQQSFQNLHVLVSLASAAGLAAATALIVRAALGSTEGVAPLHAVPLWARSPHAWLGLGALALLLVQLFSALCCHPYKRSAASWCWSWAHKVLGLATLLLAAGAAGLGFFQYRNLVGQSTALLVSAGCLGGVLVVLLCAYVVLALFVGWRTRAPALVAKEAFDSLQASRQQGNVSPAKPRKARAAQPWPPSDVKWPAKLTPPSGSPVLRPEAQPLVLSPDPNQEPILQSSPSAGPVLPTQGF